MFLRQVVNLVSQPPEWSLRFIPFMSTAGPNKLVFDSVYQKGEHGPGTKSCACSVTMFDLGQVGSDNTPQVAQWLSQPLEKVHKLTMNA